jgi:hypothetical protein
MEAFGIRVRTGKMLSGHTQTYVKAIGLGQSMHEDKKNPLKLYRNDKGRLTAKIDPQFPNNEQKRLMKGAIEGAATMENAELGLQEALLKRLRGARRNRRRLRSYCRKAGRKRKFI